eukprot:352917-Chlamydomonas_euryale.AAC.2
MSLVLVHGCCCTWSCEYVLLSQHHVEDLHYGWADASALETLKSMAYTSLGAKSLHTLMRTGPGMARPWEACPAWHKQEQQGM